MKRNRIEGASTSSSSPNRDFQFSIVDNGAALRSLSSSTAPPPAPLDEYSSLEDRLASLKLKRAALDQEIAGIENQIAAKNPFMRALGIAPEAMFSFLNMMDANTLKLVSKLAREDVRGAFWSVDIDKMRSDKRQHVANLKKWRHAFPNALSAVLSSYATFPVTDYVHLRGVRYLCLNRNRSITDAAFENLRGIHTLYMGGCTQITDKAFENLSGIHTLDVRYCTQIYVWEA